MSAARKSPPKTLTIDRPIALVGMMGAGKTTVGRRLARTLNLPFFDADAEIEKAAGMSVAELFERHGEASFRLGEAKVIERLLSGEPIVLATGGGALTDAGTRAIVASRAISVWIRADVETLARRATKRPIRPLLKTGDPKETIARLLDARVKYYEAADLVVDTKPTSHAQTVAAIVGALRDHQAKEAAP